MKRKPERKCERRIISVRERERDGELSSTLIEEMDLGLERLRRYPRHC